MWISGVSGRTESIPLGRARTHRRSPRPTGGGASPAQAAAFVMAHLVAALDEQERRCLTAPSSGSGSRRRRRDVAARPARHTPKVLLDPSKAATERRRSSSSNSKATSALSAVVLSDLFAEAPLSAPIRVGGASAISGKAALAPPATSRPLVLLKGGHVSDVAGHFRIDEEGVVRPSVGEQVGAVPMIDESQPRRLHESRASDVPARSIPRLRRPKG
jgi:hypothetical protein